MYKIISIILTLLICLSNTKTITADERVFLDDFLFVMITGKSDQDEEVIISKYYKDDSEIYSFCLEPNQKFNKTKSYYKSLNDDNYLLELVKAYYKIANNQDNYYIACQLLIWEHLGYDSYTFEGKEYKDEKNMLLKYMEENKNNYKTLDNTFELEINEICSIEGDFTKYKTENPNIEIIKNDGTCLEFKVVNKENDDTELILVPINNEADNSYIYKSDKSQDLYSFEGIFNDIQNLIIKIKVIDSEKYTSVYYSKKDTFNNNIINAEFTLYELVNNHENDEISFIQIDKDVDLKELLNIDEGKQILISERYQKYFNNFIINTSEIGYFDCSVYEGDTLLYTRKIYVSDDLTQTDSLYKNVNVIKRNISYSEDKDINIIDNVETNKHFYLCESEPSKGYVYTQKACNLIDTNTYDGEVINYVNEKRNYTLKLMKQNPEEIYLDGATFKVTYFDGDTPIDNLYTTGSLSIKREDNFKYLVIKKENDLEAKIIEFNSDYFKDDYANEGKYYYYQTDIPVIDYLKLKEKYIQIIKGGFIIENLPYSSKLIIEEIEAPAGYIITDPRMELYPDISYSEIIFKNYRINFFDIRKKDEFKIPKTCVGD